MWQILQCRGRCLEHRLIMKVSMSLRQRDLCESPHWSAGGSTQLWLAKLRTERIFIMWHPRKLRYQHQSSLVICYIIALRLLDWLCFCNKNIGFNRLKAPLRPVQHFNLLHVFFSVSASRLYPESYARALVLPFIANCGRRKHAGPMTELR